MKFIPQALTQKIGRELLTIRKNSPKTLFVAGIVGSIASTVLACRATLNLPEVLDKFKDDVEGVKSLGSEIDGQGTYTKKDQNKDLAYAYVRGTYSIFRLYAPSILLGGASIGALTGSHVTLTRRNAGLTAAYSAVQMSFDEYRKRVREEIGEEKELDVYHAAKLEKLAIDGKTEVIRRADPNKWSPYARFFDEYNQNWVKNSECNRLFVQCQQNYANNLLHARGHVFLNEVYDSLGIQHSAAGAVVGWVVGNGDNFIDFGLFTAASTEFINGHERSILLDFNVDGVIYDKI